MDLLTCGHSGAFVSSEKPEGAAGEGEGEGSLPLCGEGALCLCVSMRPLPFNTIAFLRVLPFPLPALAGDTLLNDS